MRGLACGAAAGLLALSAAADATSGRWAFRTDIGEKGCTITGTMEIAAGAEAAEARTCRFVSTETCGPDDLVPTTMEQACQVVKQADFLLIRSEVTGSLTDGVPVEAYLPDHFTLTEVSPSEMSGTWYDQLYRDTVSFWRPEPVPVS
ncbi:MAG: hypothetical protein AAF253_08260 [Pseudomonadota bacterium]